MRRAAAVLPSVTGRVPQWPVLSQFKCTQRSREFSSGRIAVSMGTGRNLNHVFAGNRETVRRLLAYLGETPAQLADFEHSHRRWG
jgi:hypothetical protein